MEAIYVLSDPDSTIVSKYKVGITTRNKNKLIQDYRRSRPEVVLYLFEKCENSRKIESIVLSKFEEHRILHQSGKPSEWVKVELNVLLKFIRAQLKGPFSAKGGERTNEERINTQLVLRDKQTPEVYSIPDFIRDGCALTRGTSESCRVLYDEYLKIPQGEKLKFLNFCKQLTKYLAEYYKIPKKDLKYKSNKIIYYRGIQLARNQVGWGCNIM